MIQTKLIQTWCEARTKRNIDEAINEWLKEHPGLQIMDIKFTTIQADTSTCFMYTDSVLIVYETGDE